ncbi:acetyltransferase [Colletotrichum sojae]|uniref:Acetyltransferase n=1 Tax=Colletotrichum sojae TaxID=2175907 RepID=A0A8H6MNC8_9PEZI|nr:acetyltransferase [Colletotrichum sojae]
MTSTASELRTRKWTRDHYLVSTDPSLVPIADLNAAFASEACYWAKPLPEPAVAEMLQQSLCFGLYDLVGPAGSAFIGFARVITDFTTFAFVTDVWVDPSTQGKGLGRWLVGCVQEVFEGMPHLRRSMLLTGDWERSVPFYERLMKMEVVGSRPGEGVAVMQMKGRGNVS